MSARFSIVRPAMMTAFLLSCMLTSAEEISEIQIEQSGPQENVFPTETLRFHMKSQEGQEYDEKTVSEDIKRFITSGLVDDAESTTEIKDGKLILKFIIKPKPIIANVRLEGNKKFETNDLIKFVKIQKNTPLNEAMLSKTRDEIQKHYADNGYNDVTIMPTVTKEADGRVNVIIKIDEGLRLKINNVIFEGNTVFSSYTLRNQIANRYSFLNFVLEVGLYQESQMESDKIRLRELYWSKGYLDFEIKEQKMTEDPEDPEFVNINYVLDEGEAYTVSGTKITGSTQFLPSELEMAIKLKDGDIFNQEVERSDAERISDHYYRLGYDDVSVIAERVPDVKNHTVTIEYKITEGERHFVRGINIVGNEHTQDRVLRREIELVPGDPYDRKKLERSQKRIMGLDYIERVDAVSHHTENKELRDLEIKVEEKEFLEARIGGAISDTDSLAGMILLRHKNFDITGIPGEEDDLLDPNSWFTGAGQTLSAAAIVGVEIMNFDIHFSEPWLFNRPYRLDVNGYYHTRYWPNMWAEHHAGFETSVTRRLSFLDEHTDLTLGYKLEAATIFDMPANMTPMFYEDERTYTVSEPGLTLSHNTTNNRFAPTSGHEVVATASIVPRFLGSSRDYVKLDLKAMQHFSWLEEAIRAHIGGKIGSRPTFGSTGHVPLYDRYFLGGGDTLRGFPFRGVGPVDRRSVNYGGQSMILLTGEVSHPIYSVVRGAVFIDAGNAWASSAGYNLKDFNIGVGYGVRINIPGIDYPIKVDLGYPIRSTVPNLKVKPRLHFDVGFNW